MHTSTHRPNHCFAVLLSAVMLLAGLAPFAARAVDTVKIAYSKNTPGAPLMSAAGNRQKARL